MLDNYIYHYKYPYIPLPTLLTYLPMLSSTSHKVNPPIYTGTLYQPPDPHPSPGRHVIFAPAIPTSPPPTHPTQPAKPSPTHSLGTNPKIRPGGLAVPLTSTCTVPSILSDVLQDNTTSLHLPSTPLTPSLHISPRPVPITPPTWFRSRPISHFT